ncbi:MAG: ABC transporter substrate-binding protein [Candidatus Limiplasma sp.]|nr:ABC transporter substrate-binding protein [Candidatus Limiplasma sp.]
MMIVNHSKRLLSLLLSVLLLLGGVSLAGAEGAEKVVNIGVTSTLGSLNPLLMDAGELNKYAQGFQFLPLFDLDAELNYVGLIGKSFSTEDNLTYTVKIDENATWSDGVPITADDVVFTALKLTSKAVGNLTMVGYAALAGFDENGNSPDEATEIEGVAKVDDKTVNFVFKAPTSQATFVNSFARYLLTIPKHKLGSVPTAELATTDWFGHPEVVSGPYIVTDFDANHYISYTANQNYWRGAPKVGKLNIKIVEGSQLYAGLQSGEIDFVQQTTGAIPQEDQASVEALTNVTSVREKPLTSQLTFFNTAKVSDVRVRQAILYAIDRNLLLEGLLEGRGEVVDGFLSSLSPFHDDTIVPTPYDPEKAKALLAEAGWDGSQKLTFIIDSGDNTFVQGASVIVAQLAEVGVQAEIRTVDFASIWNYIFAGDFDLFSVQYTLTPIDPFPDVNWLLGAGNFLGYENAEVLTLLGQIGSAKTDEETRSIYSQINRITQADVPLFNAYVVAPLGAVNNRLVNAEPHVYGSFNNVELWDVAP